MSRVTEPYDVYSLLDDLEEYRFIDSATIIKISQNGIDALYITTLEVINEKLKLEDKLPFVTEDVLSFRFYQCTNTLLIELY